MFQSLWVTCRLKAWDEATARAQIERKRRFPRGWEIQDQRELEGERKARSEDRQW